MSRTSDIYALVAQYRNLLARVNGDAAVVLAREGARLEGAILRELASGSGKLTVEQATELRQILRSLVARSSKRAARLMERHLPAAFEIASGRVAGTSAALLEAIQHPRARAIIATARMFQAKARERALVTSDFYRARWERAWSSREGNWGMLVDQIGRDLQESALRRESWKDVSGAIKAKLQRLTEGPGALTPAGRAIMEGSSISGHMAPEPFARAFARTSMREVVERESLAEAEFLGFKYFVNVGVPDDRQSEICADASVAGAMTMDEWKRWRRNPADPTDDGGPPLRHVFNCRCALIGVPTDVRGWNWKQPNPDANTYEAAHASAAA